VNYNPTTKIALVFDGTNRVEYPLQPNGDAQTFAVDPPRKARHVTLQLVSWLSDPSKRPLIGIDNIYLKAQRSPEWHATVKPMLNLGAMVHYVKGNGGVVLCNLKFQETEAIPVNLTKKRTVLATVLRNLKAPFAGGKTVLAGANLTCTPLDIHTKATTYKDERGWFGNKQRTLKALPSGEQLFAGVKYNLYEMPTSPVPQVLMLGGSGVPGNLPGSIAAIPVHTKADALFFLHTARLDRRRNDREREENKRYELCKYLIHYADGQTAELPVFAELDIDHFEQREPQSLSGAQLAWTARFEGSDTSAALYAKQWNNPRPQVEIESVDLLPGKDKDRGVPALLALTAVTTQ
jgi:beta-galactosidase